MKKIAALLVAVFVMLSGFAFADSDEISEMKKIEGYARGTLDAFCTIYEIAGNDMFDEQYTEMLYRYYKLYLAASNIESISMVKELKKTGYEVPDMDEFEQAMILLEEYVDKQWSDYMNGTITKKEYLDFMVEFVRGQIGESVLKSNE